ncbi:NrfD/PsrC family molybdoenzyme membrane anchor subunit [Acidithiobacillus ferridurans]|uniref:NrfD/PsrC family molybdoenzyme membrane anchor subunit n=1 Tax=Acidithiobacillus ferridurans TaxID=1232575 RepID=UPI001C07DEA5|nr:NrfD/PsrC family molybdoenzyme membrane anchor subunit [Acidithiobacillus ferridurans]MBU2732387.1 polysulfide reductase NrfD [Acidithiobacillus ferridurans]
MNSVHFATSLIVQDRWATLVAAYLFLGGLGAALIALSLFSHLYFRANRAVTLWGTVAGEAFLGVGSALLLIDLLHPLNVWEILMPWNPFFLPWSWIAWGTQFIVWAMVFGLLYSWPLMIDEPWFRRLPLVGRWLNFWFELPLIKLVGVWAQKLRTPIAWVAILCGVGTAVYTGLLLRSFPAATLWANDLVPPLFTVSAFSTALAFQLLVLYGVLHQHDTLARWYERLDMLLIAIEIVLIFSIMLVILPGNLSGQATLHILLHSWGWMIGFLMIGLILPFLLEIKGTFNGWKGSAPVILTACMVLLGGFLLRHYFLASGVYVFPWANAGHDGVLGAGIYHVLTSH